MTQKQIEQTRVIAEKDGFHLSATTRQGELYSKGGENCFLHNMPYLTDLNALHKVAMYVLERLYTHPKSVNIQAALFERPINGQYIDLFNAVYDGIVFLNSKNQNHDS